MYAVHFLHFYLPLIMHSLLWKYRALYYLSREFTLLL